MYLVAKISQVKGENIVGRIGGNIPQYFIDKEDDIRGYNFYVSFQNPQKPEEYITVLVPQSYDVMIDCNIYPNCSIKVFTHPFSEESDNVEYTIKHIRKSNIVGYENSNKPQYLTFSEYPILIQEEDFYIKDLNNDNYIFFKQIDEDYYPDDLIDGNYIFGYGALYLYKNIDNNKIIAGFWQYS